MHRKGLVRVQDWNVGSLLLLLETQSRKTGVAQGHRMNENRFLSMITLFLHYIFSSLDQKKE